MKDYLRTTMLLMGISAPNAFAKDISLAAASDLTAALTEIKGNYENETLRTTQTKVNLSFGSSGNLFNQIKQGAPFDLFFSADATYPDQLIDLKLAEVHTLTMYGIGRIVLWVPNAFPSDLDLDKSGLSVVLDPRVEKIAIANPAHAPYGRAAQAALDYYKLSDKVKDKLVLGENVSQAAQFIESGNAQAGIIALSLATSPAMKSRGRYWLVPAESHPKLRQVAVLLSNAPAKVEAAAFLEYLKTAAPRAIFKKYGFEAPMREDFNK